MALYEYECSVHNVFEINQSMSDPHLEECPLCRKENDISTPVKRLISLSGFQLIGSGWAKDNYK